jgi:hypothetical protein
LIDPGINGIFTLQWILKEHDKRVLNAFTWLRTGCSGGSCEHGNKPSGSVTRSNPWQAERLPASQEGLCTMPLEVPRRNISVQQNELVPLCLNMKYPNLLCGHFFKPLILFVFYCVLSMREDHMKRYFNTVCAAFHRNFQSRPDFPLNLLVAFPVTKRLFG